MKKNEIMETATQAPAVIQNDNESCFLLTDSSHQQYSSWVPMTKEEKVAFYNAINSPSESLKDFINMELEIKHVYAETCTYISKETGEPMPGVRIVLLSPDGKSYNTSSQGVFNCLSKIFAIFGQPATWTEPVKVRVKQLSKEANKNVLLLEMV